MTIISGSVADASYMQNPEMSVKFPEVEVEVQIIGLKEVYDKKTRKTNEGLEYRLENSEVTVVIQASDEITSIKAFTQRCAEAAIRTHDTIGRQCVLIFSIVFALDNRYLTEFLLNCFKCSHLQATMYL